MSRDTDQSQEPERIEREIERSRLELGRTIETLEHKLAVRHLVEKGFDMLKDNIPSSAGLNRTLDVVRANPIPFALIGVGAAWIAASSTGLADSAPVNAAKRRVSGLASDLGNRAGELASNVAGRVGFGGEPAQQDFAGSGADNGAAGRPGAGASGSGWVHQMVDVAQGAARAARGSGGALLNRAGDFAGDGASRVADQFSVMLRRQPLVMGAVGLIAGALIAALLPATEVEDEWLGRTRDDLLQRAEDAGQEAVTQVRDAAVRAAEAAGNAVSDIAKSEPARQG